MWRPRSTLCAELAALVLLLPAPSSAQSGATVPELVTDRPGFGESSAVVDRGTIQIESGLTMAEADRGTRQVTVPEVLARVGVGARLELRVSADGFIEQSVPTPSGRVSSHGRSDAEIGGKVKVLDGDHAPLDLAVLPYVSLPTGSDGFGTAHYDPGFKIAASRGLPRGFGLSATFNAADATGDDRRAWLRELSVSVDHGLAAPVGAYVEVDGAFSEGGSGCHCSVDGGIALAAGTDRQFDVEAGRGVYGAAHDWFVGLGFVIRRRR